MRGSFHKEWILKLELVVVHSDSKGLCLLNYDEHHQMHFVNQVRLSLWTSALCVP